MLSHGFVPRQFRFGTIIPIIKDKNGDAGDVNNYRGITISPIISKAFERILKNSFKDVLSSSSYQFGFKRGASTSHALFCLKKQSTTTLIMAAESIALFWMRRKHLIASSILGCT